MNMISDRFRIDLFLYAALAATALSLAFTGQDDEGVRTGIGLYCHIAAGTLLMVGSVVHVVQHKKAFKAALGRKMKVRARIRLALVSLVGALMVLACITGYDCLLTPGHGPHHPTGFLTLLALSIHAVRRVPSMARMRRRPVAAQIGRAPGRQV